MFSVPGWNVSASLKTQQDAQNAASLPNTGAPANGADHTPQSKKRKRTHRKDKQTGANDTALGPPVNSTNVVDMWEKHIEGKKPSPEKSEVQSERSKERERKKKRKDKMKEKNNMPAATAAAEDGPADKVSNDKPSKKSSKKHKLSNGDTPTDPTPEILPPTSLPPAVKLTPLQQSMRAKLASARFRHLNQTLYTTPSTSSLDLFATNPEMFTEYHTGFAQQVAVWPENPVDGYVSSVLSRGKLIEKRDPWKQKNKGEKGQKNKSKPTSTTAPESETLKPLPRNLRGASTIADLGCGVAGLSLALQPHLKPLKLTVHSFDLSKPAGPAHDLVTVADIAKLPLQDASVDVAVFCLALMGTNWLDFIDEAFRILRWRGELWVAEIKSRFGRVGRQGKVLTHSVGSQRKAPPGKKAKLPTKAQSKELAEADAKDDDNLLAVEVDGLELDAAKQATDVSAFVEVLRKRGFVLDEQEGSGKAVDLGNRMFVKMQFLKGTTPLKGKNVKKEEEGLTGRKKMRFLEDLDKEEDGIDEGTVLKPCVYKLR